MEHDFLLRYKFEFINYCYSYYEHYIKMSNVQINSDSHILHITKGSGNIFINSKSYFIKEGAVVAIPQHTLFYHEINPDFEMQNIHYKIWLNDEEQLDSFKTLPFIFYPDYFDYCRKILNQMRNTWFIDRVKLAPMAHELIIRHLTCNELHNSDSHSADQRINTVHKILKSPECIQYNAAEMAKQCFLSISQMNRKFKHYFKASPKSFWEQNRFNNVCRAMRKNDKSLAEIADDFGFSDKTYFSKWFKKTAKISPCEYRKHLLEKTFFDI